MVIENIDYKLCNGCGTCVNSCMVDVIRLDTLTNEKKEFPACQVECPAGVDMRTYMHLFRQGMFEDALNVLRESLPFPAVTGRVCPHPCELECARKDIDAAVNINAIERYLADYFPNEKAKPVRKIYAAKTAIVGSGPAGLACAYFLTRMGYPVTVFEALPVLGGMLRVGVPEFRLPKNILDSQINYIKDMGVEFKTGVTIGKDITLEDLKKEYQAVFFAIGNQLSRKLDLEGAGLDGVLWGLDYLRDVNLKPQVEKKERVVVIGGGNVAVDVALAALRLGASDVQLACLESAEEMPAYEAEIKQAKEQGIGINVSWGPKKILGKNGKITGIELVRCVSVFDKMGNFDPSYNEKETKTIPADRVILAVGQASDLSFVPKEINLAQGGTMQVNEITLETNLRAVFAGGDIVSGASSVVEAIASGKNAAISIDCYHKGLDLRAGRYGKNSKVDKVDLPPKEGITKMDRHTVPALPVDQRTGNFKEVNQTFDRWTANLEAQRCTTCGSRAVIKFPEDCMACAFCQMDCPKNCITIGLVKTQPLTVPWG